MTGPDDQLERLGRLDIKTPLDHQDIQEIQAHSRAVTLAKRVIQRRRNEAEAEAHAFIRRSPIGCTRATPRCPEARILLLDTPECCKAHVREIMALLAQMMDAAGIRWWLDYGSLLGWLRNGGMIPFDKDGDLGVYGADREKLLGLQPKLLAMGYHATYAPVRPTQRFRTGDRMKVRLSRINHTNVDLFLWHRQPGGILDRTNYIGADLYKGREMPESWVFPLQRGQWDGIDVSVPAEPERIAEHRYGESWREERREKHPPEVRE